MNPKNIAKRMTEIINLIDEVQGTNKDPKLEKCRYNADITFMDCARELYFDTDTVDPKKNYNFRVNSKPQSTYEEAKELLKSARMDGKNYCVLADNDKNGISIRGKSNAEFDLNAAFGIIRKHTKSIPETIMREWVEQYIFGGYGND